MTRRLAHLLICLFICLSSGSLAPITLGATTRPRAPTDNSLPDQPRLLPVLPAPVPGPQAQAGQAGPPAPWPADGDQARTGRLTTTITISQPLSLYRPLEPIASQPHYEAFLQPALPVSISYGAVIGRYATPPRRSPTGEALRPPATCTVNSAADSGPGGLRSCLQNAGAGETITFDPTVFPPASPATISLQSALPYITVDNLTIDASGAGVILDGSGLSSGPGLLINGASGVQIRGLQIISFPWDGIALISGASNNVIGGTTPEAGNLLSGNGHAGIWLEDPGTTGNQIQGNFIGTDVSGTTALGNLWFGVFIGFGASNNVIGGTAPGAGNLVSGNKRGGIWLEHTGTTNNTVQGNFVGTDADGTVALGNHRGIFIGFGASNNIIGGAMPEARNIISGNEDQGIQIQDVDTTGNQIQGNFIGTDVSGTVALGNLSNGIFITGGASNNIIGGAAPGAGNLISSNTVDGILLSDATGNQILGNLIGTDVTGASVLGNLRLGVFINGLDSATSANNIIGGTTSGARNLISGNEATGILLQGSGATSNQVLGNYIGTDVTGTTALSNFQSGLEINFGASNNIIGGTTPGAGNLISGNGVDGIRIQNSGTTGNQILGNSIGTDASGAVALGNLLTGIDILAGASNNIVGGSATAARNLISGNEGVGIRLQDPDTTGNQIQGNFVGTDVNGTAALGNLGIGIFIGLGASNNVIGGTAPGAGNLVSGNGDAGIWLQDPDTTGNQIQGNFVGTDVNGTAALGNLGSGILIGFGVSNNVIGGTAPEARNLVSGNKQGGIWLQETGTMRNTVQGNFVGTDVDGTAALGNLMFGIFIGLGASNNIIGGVIPEAGNFVSGNKGVGIWLQNPGTTGNQIQGNFIGADVSGTAALGNVSAGIFISFGALNNLVGGETISVGNMIAFNGDDGVRVDGPETVGNTISHNSIHDNAGLGIENINGGNAELPPPTIMTVISTSVSGQTGPNHIVEVFSDNDSEGRWFEGSVIADGSGVFTLTYSGVFSGCNLTATATDADGNTSEFSTPFPVKDCSSRIFLPIIFKSSG